MIADKHSYGFRSKRSTADAIGQCFNSLAQNSTAQFILEGDIEACFDSISHSWLENNMVIDKEMLRKWCEAGYLDKGKFYKTERGVFQGSLISPTILVATMSGLEQAIEVSSRQRDKVNVIQYADDFIVTGATREILEDKIKPVTEAFLKERGLTLSSEKTKIVHIQEEFDFLGFNIRKYNNKLLIKPSKANIKSFLSDIRKIIKSKPNLETQVLIEILNPKIRGWGNYFSHAVSKATYNYIDHNIFKVLWQWAKRRHPNKSANWVKKKYFCSQGSRDWIFHTKVRSQEGKSSILTLIRMVSISIKRHVKIRCEATPYDPAFNEYFTKRGEKRLKVEELGHLHGL